MAYKKKVAVGLSGGVDSSVAALLLKEQGYDVTGIYIQCWDAKFDGCTSEEDRVSAAKVAGTLGIPFLHLNFVNQYKEKVIEIFYDEYKKGNTPNPDILCNKEIKFGLFYEWALQAGFDLIATGHYAKICKSSLGKFELHRPLDKDKDQTYFLYLLSEDILNHVLFPLGDELKKQVREIAKNAQLHTFARPDSQGICFLGNVHVTELLKKTIKEKEGNLYFKDGTLIGTHQGAWFYTIGQRHGFKSDKYFGLPLYVLSKNVIKNEVIVGYASDVLLDKFFVSDLHWINSIPTTHFSSFVRIRNLGKLIPANMTFVHDNLVEVVLSEKEWGVAPGQSAVFYDGTRVMGGGIIQ